MICEFCCGRYLSLSSEPGRDRVNKNVIVLGAGMTGLGAGMSGLPIYEAAERPGGICSSYYMPSGSAKRLPSAPKDDNAYRFEVGGGHWIFGGDPGVLHLLRSLTSVNSYSRKSAVWFPDKALLVPYPLQNHLRYLGPELATHSLHEMIEASTARHKVTTLANWLRASFGETLCDLFFGPFHQMYTAGLWEKIAPQDAYKSPVNLDNVVQGILSSSQEVGYNTAFIYPEEGLDGLAQRMASSCKIHYGKRVVRINPVDKEICFADGSTVQYRTLVSTLPLNRMTEMAGLGTTSPPDPSPSVLVLNIGAVRGPHSPKEHWVYVPVSHAGFHRVGFYSNVDVSFLPQSSRGVGDRVSLYIEKAYPEGHKPSAPEVSVYSQEVVKELQAWGWIGEVDVLDPTWIEVAYTWSWAGSHWRQQALSILEQHDIYQIGRYGRWVFQGIADSIRDGLMVGAAIAGSERCRPAWVGPLHRAPAEAFENP